MGGAGEVLPELRQPLGGLGLQVGDDLVHRAVVAGVISRVGMAADRHGFGSQCFRLMALGFDAGEHLVAPLLEHVLGKHGLAQGAHGQGQCFRQVPGRDAQRHLGAAGVGVDAQPGIQCAQAVLEGLARQLFRAREHHGVQQVGFTPAAREVLQVAPLQVQRQVYAIALHLARQDGVADAIGQLTDLGAFGDAGWGECHVGREGLGLLPFVVLQQGGDVGARRVGGTDRLGRGQVPGQRAVVAHQPAAAGGTDLVQRHGLGPVGLGEGQAPVSLGHGFGQRHGQGLGVFGQALHAVPDVLLGAVQGFLRQRQFAFEHLAQGVPDDLPLVFRGQRGAEQQHARVVQVG